jgi:hypothetical protein
MEDYDEVSLRGLLSHVEGSLLDLETAARSFTISQDGETLVLSDPASIALADWKGGSDCFPLVHRWRCAGSGRDSFEVAFRSRDGLDSTSPSALKNSSTKTTRRASIFQRVGVRLSGYSTTAHLITFRVTSMPAISSRKRVIEAPLRCTSNASASS